MHSETFSDVLVDEPEPRYNGQDALTPHVYASLAEALGDLPYVLMDSMWVHITILVQRTRPHIENVRLYLDLSITPYCYLDDDQGGLFLVDCPVYDAFHLNNYLVRDRVPAKYLRGPAGCAMMLRWG